MAEPFLIETKIDYSNRCFLDRMGSSLQWGSKIRAMVRGGENVANRCGGTTSNKISSILPHQSEKSEIHALSERQQGIPSFSTECSSRREIKEKNRLFRVASLPQNFSRGYLTTMFSNHISICFPPMPSNTSIYSLKTRFTVRGLMQ